MNSTPLDSNTETAAERTLAPPAPRGNSEVARCEVPVTTGAAVSVVIAG